MSFLYNDPIPQDLTGFALKTDIKPVDLSPYRLKPSAWVGTTSYLSTWFYRPVPGNVTLSSLEFEFSYSANSTIGYPFHVNDFATGWTTNGFYTGNIIMPNDTRAYNTGKGKGFTVTLPNGEKVLVAVATFPNNYFIVNVIWLPSGFPNGFIRQVYANGVLVVYGWAAS